MYWYMYYKTYQYQVDRNSEFVNTSTQFNQNYNLEYRPAHGGYCYDTLYVLTLITSLWLMTINITLKLDINTTDNFILQFFTCTGIC